MKFSKHQAAFVAALVAAGATALTASAATANYTLNPLVVTANRTVQTITQAGADMTIITAKELRNAHVQNLQEALQTVPGVQFNNYNGVNNFNIGKIYINGSSNIVVLLNGVRISAFQGDENGGIFDAILRQNIENIDRIEVLRGAASTLYGGDAQGGVINIITKDHSKRTGSVTAVAGVNSRQQIFVGDTVDHFSYDASYYHTSMGNVTDAKGEVAPQKANTNGGSFNGTYMVDKDHKVILNVEKSHSTVSGRDIVYEKDFHGYFSNQSVSLTDYRKLDANWQNTLTFRVNNTESLYIQGTQVKVPMKNDFRTITDHANFKNDRHNVVIGMTYNYGKNTADESFPSKTSKDLELYVQDTMALAPKVDFTAGLRHMSIDTTNVKASKNVTSFRLAYKPNETSNVFVSRNEYFIIPSLYQLFSAYGNPNLKPGEGYTTTVGFATAVPHGLVTASWYNTDSKVGFSYDPATYKALNAYGGVSRGINLQWNQDLGNGWSTQLGYSHMYLNSTNLGGGYSPKDLFTTSITYHKDQWTANFNGRWFVRQPNAGLAYGKDIAKPYWPSNSYGVFNFNLTYSPVADFSAFVQVNNVFNTEWAIATNVGNAWGGLSKWYAMPGRNFALGATVKF